MTASVLELDHLTRRFGDLVAVDDLTLQVEPARIFGLLGSNGAGKTTLIKILTTLLPPSAGSARVAGFDIRRQAAEVRRDPQAEARPHGARHAGRAAGAVAARVR